MRYLEEILVLDEEVARIMVQKGKLQSIHQKVLIHQMFVTLTAIMTGFVLHLACTLRLAQWFSTPAVYSPLPPTHPIKYWVWIFFKGLLVESNV